MVSNAVITSIIIQLVLSIFVPIIVFIYLRKKYRINWKVVGVGILVFIGFAQILETPLHVFMLGNPTTSKILENPFLYALYGGFAAGIFEEVGRFIAFFFLLKKYQEYKDGFAYGIGHGGIESILIGGLAGLQALIFATSINNGSFAQLIEKTPQLSQVQDALLSAPSYLYLLGGVERMMALVLQISFTMLVLYGVKQKKYIFVIYAVLFHALVDFFAALYQKQVLNIFVTESIFFIFTIFAFILIRNMREKLTTEPSKS
ncbi:YhfC family intramembrane metalloprotease [Bacillus cytotoxicus]|uniref:YhfC family intramembrane metalloprotease n=1 Tax=Bacillus cytotoxicus TaxID=580165 RepID=UPI001AEDBF0A|nr:YhfC family intramembrane metalloprotease [Bacillus cytotoxicus]MDH2881651.1 YhfC family intramembrane metalloprotease [Bacillus cytotoxicus]QTR79650.1 YhfC family intramembrane metalloprotease [Bacillus cytotoxicus]